MNNSKAKEVAALASSLRSGMENLYRAGLGKENSPEEQAAVNELMDGLTAVFISFGKVALAQSLGIEQYILRGQGPEDEEDA